MSDTSHQRTTDEMSMPIIDEEMQMGKRESPNMRWDDYREAVSEGYRRSQMR